VEDGRYHKSRDGPRPTTLVPEHIFRLFEFQEKKRGEDFLFSKACKSLYRRRFKEIEDTPLAGSV
jgi:hypothetical protein